MPQHHRLRVVGRPQQQSKPGNLFAKLPKSRAVKLQRDALKVLEQNRQAKCMSSSSWTASAADPDFLPLELHIPSTGETIYVSYNGGDVPSVPSGTCGVLFFLLVSIGP